MKKIITALALMIVLAGVAFAADNDTLYVTALVKTSNPSYVIYGGLTEGVATNIVGNDSPTPTTDNTVELDFDPSDTSDSNKAKGKVYVKLVQSTLAKTVATVNLTIEGTPLVNTQGADTNLGLADLTSSQTDNPSASVVSTTENVTGITHVTGTPSASGNIVTYQIKYTGTNVAAGTIIGVSSFTWAPIADLPVGNYQATITLTYTPH